MVEHSLAKAEVEGSSPSFRSRLRRSVVTSGVRQSSVKIRYAEGFFFFHRDGVGLSSLFEVLFCLFDEILQRDGCPK